MIALVDYGAGNLRSVRKALETLGASVTIAERAADLDDARGIIVPGVGHFNATSRIDDDMRTALTVRAGTTPVLGICLGLQFLFEGSDESPGNPGLDVLRGRCFRLPPTAKVPHVGWNTVDVRKPSRILRGVESGSYFYFTHSFAAPLTDACVGETTYTAPFAAVVESRNVFGVQFHPEKSGDAGLQVLRNFLAEAAC